MGVLDNKVAIITGASSGIGRVAAKLFASEGAKVVVTSRRQAELGTLVKEIESFGGSAKAVVGDVRHEDLAQALTTTALDAFGGLDIAFNNAGSLGEMKAGSELSVEEWRNTLASNLTSSFLCAKYQIPAITTRGGGSLIFTSTSVGHNVGFPAIAGYAAAKAGLVGLTRVLAVELGEKSIRVNTILAGGDTPMGRSVAGTPDMKGFVEHLHALKRIAQPGKIAEAALYLASDASSFVTGSAFSVDGGLSICRT